MLFRDQSIDPHISHLGVFLFLWMCLSSYDRVILYLILRIIDWATCHVVQDLYYCLNTCLVTLRNIMKLLYYLGISYSSF
jgi:hypothetical protein